MSTGQKRVAPPEGHGGPEEAGERPGVLPGQQGERLHPVTPWRRAWAPIAGIAGIAMQDFERTREWYAHLTVGWLLVGFAVLLPVVAAYGFLSWWYTSYLVTDTELRIRTGLVFRRTAHIRLDRIQAIDIGRPLPARIVQVAKLKIDVVGTNSKDELAFVGEREAVALREELLARAAGSRAAAGRAGRQEPSEADRTPKSGDAPETDAVTASEEAPEADGGRAPARELLRVDTRMLAVSLVLLVGSSWLALLAVVAVPVLLYLVSENPWLPIAAALTLSSVFWRNTGKRFLAWHGWTVTESSDGIGIDRGMLDREHESVLPGRVQYVRIVEPLLWRRLGWVRVVLAVAGGTGDGDGVLVPVATRAEAARVLAGTFPGLRLEDAAEAIVGVPARARWRKPFQWPGYGHGVTDTVFVARRGRLRRLTEFVPHAKVQSVRFVQGPWLRWLGLADVSVDHGADGSARARFRDATEARALVAAQAERSRLGRRTQRDG